MADHLLSASAVARELGVSRQYVSKIAKQGKLASIRLGRYRLFERAEVEKYAERRTSKAIHKILDKSGPQAQDVAQ